MRELFLLWIFIWMTPALATQPSDVDRTEAESIVQKFQRIPHRYFFCLNDDWSEGGGEKEALEVERIFSPFFEKMVLGNFLWSQCSSKRVPEAGKGYGFYYDFRFGLEEASVKRESDLQAKNIRVGKLKKYSNYGVFSVRVVFDTPHNKNLVTDYYLKKKEGRWVIHEIVPHGIPDGPDDSRMYQSDGVLTEMLDAYIEAVRNSKAAVMHK
ncbi:hypothetical protein [Chitinimonas taiwanensis]|uniref:ABC-type transporter Mla maintaining outer membrane lipid asymmetry, MlaC component n=1 Tax=Chitinimonas taiwanensis DSM 18899 TaxID=1121279 RepID=A0A1K2HSM5_9NEIS|nr:hypothetical protein [Chitinimonas taiwanensis]SFZ79561.1 ABC-type transporter Mla maintaining outer membrane lipid asymmetry, MlaC component [Chitinimonas taiwanensis DSM 18899]